ncbi:MAG: ABC transporter substrate-binding protein [Actinomycetota bacterium]
MGALPTGNPSQTSGPAALQGDPTTIPTGSLPSPGPVQIPRAKNRVIRRGETIKVGGLFPLTEGLSTLGKEAFRGAQAYFNHINDQGGVARSRFVFDFCDDKADDTLSTTCAKKLVEQDRVFIMGPSFTPFSLSVVDYLRREGVPWVGYDGINVEGFTAPNIVTAGAAIETMAHALLPYWYHKVERDTGSPPRRIGAVVLDSAPALTYLREAKDVICPRLGCQVTREKRVTYSTTEFGTICQSMQGSVDVIWIITDPASAAKLMVQCQSFKPPKGYLGQHGIYLGVTLDQSGRTAEGMLANGAVLPDLVDSPATTEMRRIVHRYFPGASFGYFTVLSYVSAQMVVDLVRSLFDSGGELSRQNIIATAGGMTSYACGGLCKDVNLRPPAAQSGGNHNVWIVRADFSTGRGRWVYEAGPIDAFRSETWPCPGRARPC